MLRERTRQGRVAFSHGPQQCKAASCFLAVRRNRTAGQDGLDQSQNSNSINSKLAMPMPKAITTVQSRARTWARERGGRTEEAVAECEEAITPRNSIDQERRTSELRPLPWAIRRRGANGATWPLTRWRSTALLRGAFRIDNRCRTGRRRSVFVKAPWIHARGPSYHPRSGRAGSRWSGSNPG